MKRFYFLLISLLLISDLMAQTGQPCATCLPEGITFTTQVQIDNFQANYPGCSEILGHLTIDGNDINNLNGLNVLTSIGGTVLIPTNPSLTSLSGLESMTAIGGNLTIFGNASLTSLTGLESLSTIAGSLTIAGNNPLSNLSGLDSLTSIGGNFVISDIYSLTSLTGLESLTSIGGHLSIFDNDSLISLTGLENLISIGGYIRIGDQNGGNNALTSLTGLDNINAGSITELHIVYNNSLSTCNVQSICDYLAAPGGSIEIHHNATGCDSPGEVRVACDPNLCVPDGIWFSTQNQVDSFQIYYPDCDQILGDVWIGGGWLGSNINNLTGLSTLTSIEGDLSIYSNDFLVNLTGLDNLTSIGGYLYINFCDVLTSLTGLNNLTSIGGDLIIGSAYPYSGGGNPALTSLTGIENIDAGSITNLNISYNSSLSACAVQSICDYLAAPNGWVEFCENAPGCNSPEEVEAACTVGVGESAVGSQQSEVSIYPNPAINFITIELAYTTTLNKNTTLAIYNTNGQLLKQSQITKPQTVVNVSALNAGVYFVKIVSGDSVMVGKFWKQ